MRKLVGGINAFTRWVGERVTWLTTLLVLLVFLDVILRYLFATSHAWYTDLEWHCFALIFLMGAPYALKKDQHVRVDILYTNWTPKRQALVNLIETLIFLIPWCLIVIYTSFHYAENAFVIHERSPEPGGLAARWVIKGAITLGFAMLLIQAIALMLQSIQTLTQGTRKG